MLVCAYDASLCWHSVQLEGMALNMRHHFTIPIQQNWHLAWLDEAENK